MDGLWPAAMMLPATILASGCVTDQLKHHEQLR